MKKLSLTRAELRQISDSIRHDFDQYALRETIELVINPVDPYHIHACWNIGGSAFIEQSSEHHSLVLQLFWDDSIENHNFRSDNQFHVMVDEPIGRKTLRAPVDNVYYRGIIGWGDSSFTVEQIAESNIIHLPRAVMLSAPVEQPVIQPQTKTIVDRQIPETGQHCLQIPDEAELHDRILHHLSKSGFEWTNLPQDQTHPDLEQADRSVDIKVCDDDDSKEFDETGIDQLIMETLKHSNDYRGIPGLQSIDAPSSPLYSNHSGRSIKF
ncbi:MAG: DUF4912 domain-containing protein [Gammaproteobacteria bacterium]|nr:DUF4912 domain-containing protein [Gammaproteobacteria bacterium]